MHTHTHTHTHAHTHTGYPGYPPVPGPNGTPAPYPYAYLPPQAGYAPADEEFEQKNVGPCALLAAAWRTAEHMARYFLLMLLNTKGNKYSMPTVLGGRVEGDRQVMKTGPKLCWCCMPSAKVVGEKKDAPGINLRGRHFRNKEGQATGHHRNNKDELWLGKAGNYHMGYDSARLASTRWLRFCEAGNHHMGCVPARLAITTWAAIVQGNTKWNAAEQGWRYSPTSHVAHSTSLFSSILGRDRPAPVLPFIEACIKPQVGMRPTLLLLAILNIDLVWAPEDATGIGLYSTGGRLNAAVQATIEMYSSAAQLNAQAEIWLISVMYILHIGAEALHVLVKLSQPASKIELGKLPPTRAAKSKQRGLQGGGLQSETLADRPAGETISTSIEK
eukprot:1161433-Pelagomonas_calceolata.AAC.5